MSSSESDSSYSSPRSYAESPQSSPYQEVPYCTILYDETAMHVDGSPFLRILEQPQDHFRFRYRSEMVGTHGCLLGRNNSNFKTKTHPTVELLGYQGRAIVRCRLAQISNSNDHPHQLLEDEEDRDVTQEISADNKFIAKFQGMGIIHTAKKEVPTLLYQQYSQIYENHEKRYNSKELRSKCDHEAKNINLNIVRLKFTAHDMAGNLICPPVLSEPIHNMKSAATNDLKICRISRLVGSPKGGDDVFIFVEKVNKKNIQIRFVEKSPSDEVVWMAEAKFSPQSDVHHQYGIAFKTPAYRNTSSSTNVKVNVELFRPSDGRSSDPIAFTYKAEHVYKQNKKRRNESYSSLGSSGGGSVKSFSDLPISVVSHSKEIIEYELPNNDITAKLSYLQMQRAPLCEPLAEALYDKFYTKVYDPSVPSPVLSQPNVPIPPAAQDHQFDSADIKEMLDGQLPSEEYKTYIENFGDLGTSIFGSQSIDDVNSMDLFRSSMNLVADSGSKKSNKLQLRGGYTPEEKSEIKLRHHTDFYNVEDDLEVKKLIKELYDISQNKAHMKDEMRAKLQRLFELRLNNGDTFLHMALNPKLAPIMEFIVKLCYELKTLKLLNLVNRNSETILHVAIKDGLDKHIGLLISKGCDPMLEDAKGNNAVHYCVKYQTCLAELLAAVKLNRVACDLNAYNIYKQTALHIAVKENSPFCCGVLLNAGADPNVRDGSGRTALHLATYDDKLDPLSAILEHISMSDVDRPDGRGNTALQLVCDIHYQPNSYQIAKLLLSKGANPLKSVKDNECAWKIICEKSHVSEYLAQLKDLLQEYLPTDYTELADSEEKYESADEEYESADEGEPDKGLECKLLYLDELSSVLDRSGRWKALAKRLKCDTLLNWFEVTSSPTTTLFSQIEEMDEGYTSRSLAMTLKDMGDNEAAEIILRYLQ